MRCKVCGISEASVYRKLADSGLVDYAGFIFYPESPRCITPEEAAEICSYRKGHSLKNAGVFVNADPEFVKRTAELVPLDIVQLHGEESPEYCESLRLPYWKAIRVSCVEDYGRADMYQCSKFLIDSYMKDTHGGTGRKIPEQLKEEAYKRAGQLIIAGGLIPSDLPSVAAAGFYGADINSGIESSPGKKDHKKLEELFSVLEEIDGK